MIEVKQKYNKAAFFLTIMLERKLSDFKNHINVYVGDVDRPDLNSHLFILVSSNDSLHQRSLIEKTNLDLTFTIGYQEDYPVGEGFQMYVFKIPDQFVKDVELFKIGKYSQMSAQYKIQYTKIMGRVLQAADGSKPENPFWKYLHPTQEERDKLASFLDTTLAHDCEIYSSPDLDKEVFNRVIFNN